MQLKNSYYYFVKAIPKETCERIIELGTEKMEKLSSEGKDLEAFTYGEQQKGAKPSAAPQGDLSKQQLKEKGVTDVYVRDSKATWLNEKWLYDLVYPYIAEANIKAGWNFQYDYSESFQFTVYEPGGFYSWHSDGGSDHFSVYQRYIYGVTPIQQLHEDRLPEKWVTDHNMVGKVRKISMTLNLTDPEEYDGGDLMFDFGSHSENEQFHTCSEAREQGSIIIFPSFVTHCVSPISRGKRYSLVLWTLGKPFQ
jgi:PKHD-type hydroxylase